MDPRSLCREANLTIEYEFTDEIAVRASRESILAQRRKLFTPLVFVLVLFSAVMLYFTLRDGGHWLFLWACSTVVGLFVALVTGWLALLWWAPRAVKARVAHLADRRVVIELTDADLRVNTATASSVAAWSEVKELRSLPNFWVLVYRSDAEIPIPRAAVPPEAVMLMQTRIAPR